MRGLKYVIATCVAACALTGLASAAQAATIGPAGASFKAESSNSELKFSGIGVKCTKSVAEGKAENPVGMNASLTGLTFGGTCTTTLGGTVKSVTTSGFPWSITAETATGGGSGTGSITIPSGGKAVIITSGFFAECEITVAGPQANKRTLTLNHASNELVANVSLNASAKSTGGSGCLIAGSGTATFTGNYPFVSGSPEINP